MPGSVQNASPATVLPNNVARSWRVVKSFLVRVNFYRDGSSQVGLLASTDRTEWELTEPLGMTALVALRDFIDARGVESFYFYDLVSHKTAVFDPTGVLTAGRYTVRFDRDWSQAADIARTLASIRMVEVN